MSRWVLLPVLFFSSLCFGQNLSFSPLCMEPREDDFKADGLVQSGITATYELHGLAHTIRAEAIDYESNPLGVPVGSDLAIRDPKGCLMESFSYKPDGAVFWRTKFTRRGPQVFRIEATCANIIQSFTFVQRYDSDGRVTGSETYDGSGVLLSKIINHYPSKDRRSDDSAPQTTDWAASPIAAVGSTSFLGVLADDLYILSWAML